MTLLDQERKINTLAGLLLYPPGTEWDSSLRVIEFIIMWTQRMKLMLLRVQALVVLPGPDT